MNPNKITSEQIVPNLTTALTGPLALLETHLLSNQATIEAWLREEWLKTPAPFYASVDLRNSGFKLAPVDTNLFPAGFNNLNPAFLPLIIQAVQAAIEKHPTPAKRILIIPESHTRNLYYLENIYKLCSMLNTAGFDARIGSLLPEKNEIQLPSGNTIILEPLERNGNRVRVGDFEPCLLILNNDLSDGIPEILDGIEQQITPPTTLGWNLRLKSDHFRFYSDVATEFAKIIDIDPWLVNPIFTKCGEINFMSREGENCLAESVAMLLDQIQQKYDEHGVTEKPFVLLKADSGTYGMGVMTIHDPSEIHKLNRKQRTKMSASKGGQSVSQVILQEGVYTFETLGEEQAVAEPVVYMVDHFVVGGFYRVHKSRSVNENLNAPGMHFEPLAFADSCTTPDKQQEPTAEPNRFYAYGVIARLALLAAAREATEEL